MKFVVIAGEDGWEITSYTTRMSSEVSEERQAYRKSVGERSFRRWGSLNLCQDPRVNQVQTRDRLLHKAILYTTNYYYK